MTIAGASNVEEYELKRAVAPRLAGAALSTFAYVARTTLGRRVHAIIVRNSGLFVLRQKRLNDGPTYYPSVPPGQSHQKELANSQLISAFLKEPLDSQPSSHLRTSDEYHCLYLSGKATPVQVAEAVLDAIEHSNATTPPLAAFVKWRREVVLEQAAESAERWRLGRQRGVLDGVPVAVKDEFDLAGFTSGLGTSFMDKLPAASADAVAIARLKAAGAIIVGKTSMHEIGIGVFGYNSASSTPRNPFNTYHITGGSSSGSAAAVAARLVPIALGVDGGGSIRIPASFCGCVGLKPTYGRVPLTGLSPLAPSVGHAGVLAATVRDTALGYAAIAGPDASDTSSVLQPPPTLSEQYQRITGANDRLDGLRLGVYEPWNKDATPDVVRCFEEAVEALVQRGAEVIKVRVPELEEIRVAHIIIILSEMLSYMQAFPQGRHYEFGAATTGVLYVASHFTSNDFVLANTVRTRAIHHMTHLFSSCDVLLSPCTGVTAPPVAPEAASTGLLDPVLTSDIMRFAFLANLTGIPALTVPCGQSSSPPNPGLPVGIQIMGPWWSEDLLLHVGAVVEQTSSRLTPKVMYACGERFL